MRKGVAEDAGLGSVEVEVEVMVEEGEWERSYWRRMS
jgi:hypothetical protein